VMKVSCNVPPHIDTLCIFLLMAEFLRSLKSVICYERHSLTCWHSYLELSNLDNHTSTSSQTYHLCRKSSYLLILPLGKSPPSLRPPNQNDAKVFHSLTRFWYSQFNPCHPLFPPCCLAGLYNSFIRFPFVGLLLSR